MSPQSLPRLSFGGGGKSYSKANPIHQGCRAKNKTSYYSLEVIWGGRVGLEIQMSLLMDAYYCFCAVYTESLDQIKH